MHRRKKENLEKQLEEAQGVIDGLKDSKADIQTKVKELDQQLTSISLEITNTQAQLEEKECRDYRHPERIRGCPGGCGKPGRSYEQKGFSSCMKIVEKCHIWKLFSIRQYDRIFESGRIYPADFRI